MDFRIATAIQGKKQVVKHKSPQPQVLSFTAALRIPSAIANLLLPLIGQIARGTDH